MASWVLILGAAGLLRAQIAGVTPTPTVTATAVPLAALPGDAEVKDLASRVTAVDAAAVLQPPAAPTGVKVELLKEGVYLEWDEAPLSSGAVSYNVYRSVLPGAGYGLVNAGSVTVSHFFDGGANSLDPPKQGETYFYVVAAVDPSGGVSPYSAEVSQEVKKISSESEDALWGKKTKKKKAKATAKDEKVIDIPERNLFKLNLPADSQLSIQGYKRIAANFSRYNYFNRPDTQILPRINKVTDISQELVVSINGKIGENVDVHVDFSDQNRPGSLDNSKQEISIVYHGEPDKPIQEIAFGDLLLSIPNTEFAGFNKQLFGLQAKLKVDKFRFTGLFAQTKGITETKTFHGGYVQVDRTIQDIEYFRRRYYIVTKRFVPSPLNSALNLAFPREGTLQIWVDDGNPYNNSGTNFIGTFERFLPGLDYSYNSSTGILTFIRSGGVQDPWRIAVAYEEQTGASVGMASPGVIDLSSGLAVPTDGIVSDGAHLIKDNVDALAVSPLYLPNVYDLGRDKIIPPDHDSDFVFEILTQGNELVQSGLAPDGSKTWAVQMDLDLNQLTVKGGNDPAFPERPFMGETATQGTALNEPYNPTAPSSRFRMRLKYKNRVDFFRLDRFNIVRGSESVYVNGSRKTRDKDYQFDYTSGYLSFQDQSLIDVNTDIVVTYEYAPFGSAGQSNILGARAEYDLSDHLFLGSTFLYNSAQSPQDTPQLGSTPSSIRLLDADARYDLTRGMIKSFTSLVPGLGKFKPPLDVRFSAEIASSSFNPDSYKADTNGEGEKGVAMVDNMEGIDDAISAYASAGSWVASSAPRPLYGLSSYVPVIPVAGDDLVNNNRIRFMDEGVYYESVTQNGGHLYDGTIESTRVSVLQIPYSRLTNQRWGGIRTVIDKTGRDATGTKFLETWIYNDGVDKWIGVDFGVMNEDSNGPGNRAVTNWGTLVGVDEEKPTCTDYNNITTCNSAPSIDYGLKIQYFNWLFDNNPYAGEPVPNQEGHTNGLLDIKDINGNQYLDSTNAYFSYVFRPNWGVGWHLVKIPVDLAAASDTVSTTTDGMTYLFHNEGASPTSPVVRTVRLWMTGATASEVRGSILLESLRLTKNRWEASVDAMAVTNRGAVPDPSKFNASSINRDVDSSYEASIRFVVIQQNTDADNILKTEKALRITYNLSSDDLEPRGDPSGSPVYFATRRFSSPLDFTDAENLALDLNLRSSVTPGEILFVRLENDSQNYYQFNIPLDANPLGRLTGVGNWTVVSALLDGSDQKRVKVGRPFINRVNQISIGVICPNPGVNQVREFWVNNLRALGSSKREGIAKRFNTITTLGKNFATISTRYREVDGGFSQLDQTGTHFQLSRQTGVDFVGNNWKLFKEPIGFQASYSRDDKITESALKDNPFYYDLPDISRTTRMASLNYSKALPKGMGRLTSLRLSGSDVTETDRFLGDYLLQPNVQGNYDKGSATWSLNSTYDAPRKIWKIPLGTNQFNQNFTFTNDTQRFEDIDLFDYERHTRNQNYGWTNSTEVFKKLMFTPGYSWNLVEAKGNTTFAGQPGRVETYIPITKQMQPRAGLVYSRISGFTPSINYTGSNRYDFGSFTGARLNTVNNLNYNLNFQPGALIKKIRKIGLTINGGRSEQGSATIQDYIRKRPLTLQERWGLRPPDGIVYNSNRTITHQGNGSFTLFNRIGVNANGSWNDQWTVSSEGANPTRTQGRTLGLSTSYTKKLFRIPLIRFGVNSATFQFSRNDNANYDSSSPPRLDLDSSSRTYAVEFPYDINRKAQGKLRLSRTRGGSNQRGVLSVDDNRQGQLEYTQQFLQNKVVKIPLLGWKIKFRQAMELRLIYLADYTRKNSDNILINQKTDRYRGTVELKYNALKNILSVLSLSKESFRNRIVPALDYNLFQGSLSLEARF